MRFRLLVVAAMLLAGCVSQQPPGLSDTKSETKNQANKDRDRDSYECAREATFAGIGTKQQAYLLEKPSV